MALGNQPSAHSHPRSIDISQRIASPDSARTIATLINRLSAAAAKNAARTNRSLRRRRGLPRMSSSVIGCLVVVVMAIGWSEPTPLRVGPATGPDAVGVRARPGRTVSYVVPVEPVPAVAPVEPDAESQVDRVVSIMSVESSTYPVWSTASIRPVSLT